MVKTALLWHWRRAKIQWKFLLPRQRRLIKWDLFWAASMSAFLIKDIFFPFGEYSLLPRWFWIASGVILTAASLRLAWVEYTFHLSPELLTDEELTKGTE